MTRRLAALGLVAWLAGTGCLLGCSASSAYAATSQLSQGDSQTAEQPDSCAAMSGHDCCAPVEREEGEETDGRASVRDERRGRHAMHCPLGRRHASDPARKVRDTSPTASRAAQQSPAPRPDYVSAPDAARLLVRDRGSTYLRCCAFLI